MPGADSSLEWPRDYENPTGVQEPKEDQSPGLDFMCDFKAPEWTEWRFSLLFTPSTPICPLRTLFSFDQLFSYQGYSLSILP